MAVDSNKLEFWPATIDAGFGFGVGGRSHSNVLSSTEQRPLLFCRYLYKNINMYIYMCI